MWFIKTLISLAIVVYVLAIIFVRVVVNEDDETVVFPDSTWKGMALYLVGILLIVNIIRLMFI